VRRPFITRLGALTIARDLVLSGVAATTRAIENALLPHGFELNDDALFTGAATIGEVGYFVRHHARPWIVTDGMPLEAEAIDDALAAIDSGGYVVFSRSTGGLE